MALLTSLAAFLALLTLAALEDLRARRIPNWVSGGLAALYPVFVLASPSPVAWLSALALALAVFLVGLFLFAHRLLGGGDVKLITAVSLWAGLEHILIFAIVTSLAGGVLALGAMAVERWRWLIDVHLAGLGWDGSGRAGAQVSTAGPEDDAPAAADSLRSTLPYAVAIAAGGLFVAVQLMKP